MRGRARGCAGERASERAGERAGERGACADVRARERSRISLAHIAHIGGRARSLTFKGGFWQNKALFFQNPPLKVSERGGVHAHVRIAHPLAHPLAHSHAHLRTRALTRARTRTPARSPAHSHAHPRAHPRAHLRTHALTRSHLGRSVRRPVLQISPQKCFK